MSFRLWSSSRHSIRKSNEIKMTPWDAPTDDNSPHLSAGRCDWTFTGTLTANVNDSVSILIITTWWYEYLLCLLLLFLHPQCFSSVWCCLIFSNNHRRRRAWPNPDCSCVSSTCIAAALVMTWDIVSFFQTVVETSWCIWPWLLIWKKNITVTNKFHDSLSLRKPLSIFLIQPFNYFCPKFSFMLSIPDSL